MTLRRRVMAAMVALVALFTIIQGGIAVLSMHEQEDELVDELVLAEALRLADRIEHSGPDMLIGPDSILLPQHYEAWWVGAGRSVPGPLPKPLAGLSDGPHMDSAADGEFHIQVLPVAGGRLYLRHDASRNEEKVRDFTLQVVVLGLFFIALAAWIAVLVSRRLIAPLEKVAQLLDHWAPASEPGAVPAVDEERRVFEAFQRVQLRWERGLARESERLADMHHEIRTPLAALRTDLEMLQELVGVGVGAGAGSGQLTASAAPAALQMRLQRSLAAVDAVAGALESMRALRAGRVGPAAPVKLADCVEDAWASLGELPASRALTLANGVDPQCERMLDRQALMAILRNLFRNAAEHAAPATLSVHEEGDEAGHALVVADDGPGIAERDIAFVFERYYRGRLGDSAGAADPADPADPSDPADQAGSDYQRGLGLAIARQLAEANGWQLSVAANVPRGTRFVITFGDAPPR